MHEQTPAVLALLLLGRLCVLVPAEMHPVRVRHVQRELEVGSVWDAAVMDRGKQDDRGYNSRQDRLVQISASQDLVGGFHHLAHYADVGESADRNRSLQLLRVFRWRQLDGNRECLFRGGRQPDFLVDDLFAEGRPQLRLVAIRG